MYEAGVSVFYENSHKFTRIIFEKSTSACFSTLTPMSTSNLFPSNINTPVQSSQFARILCAVRKYQSPQKDEGGDAHAKCIQDIPGIA